ncbi:hypothetical protein GCM10009425_32960 [Pseudomonas asuensis]|jgi:hypothetical protein|uniref:Uncharacterized protein n=1 Tax=Pseudomonas asuensis TaxID=1825787 RepID=A0ABQ2H045_9PSED|nr:hypothetical protein [Pseudomonas asuensis]GGM19473.1 hypothetical protein GCM10009425_32960 [Pseudomonas asuensis]
MKQRTVQDEGNITWTCVEAFSGGSRKTAEAAKTLTKDAEGNVTVVCTPGGGEQSVRLSLPETWLEQTSDQALLDAIQATKA